MEVQISKINSKKKSDIVLEKVLDFIVEGKYVPGDRLPAENELSEKFGVSRVTVRESFKQLSILGVVDIRQGEGTFVNKITPSTLMEPLFPLMLIELNDFEELFQARICIESGTAQLASRNRTEDDIDKLQSLIQPMQECIETEDFNLYSELDAKFHMLIGEASKNKILLNMYKMLKKVRDRCIRVSNNSLASITHSLNGHKEILDAIIRKDEVNIVSLMNLHLNYSKRVNEETFTQ